MVALMYQLGLHHLKAWLGLNDALPKWIIQMASKFFLAIGWGCGGELSVPLPVCLPQDCSSTLLAWWLVFPQASGHCNAFYLTSEVTRFQFLNILLVTKRQPWFNKGVDYIGT